jgi:uncharacterized membrane protein
LRAAAGKTVEMAAGLQDSPVAPGLLMGIGLGGFVDGILLHQILQWHHMLTSTGDYPSNTIAGLEANTLATASSTSRPGSSSSGWWRW